MIDPKKMPGLDTEQNTNNNYNSNPQRKPVAICNKLKGKVQKELIERHSNNFKNCLLSSLELASSIKAGNAFCSQFEGTRRKASFLQTGFIALDIDSGMTIQEALEDSFIKENASFIYTTPSHKLKDGADDRFRIVFQLETPISAGTTVTNLIKILLQKISKADPSCKDPCRMFFGSPNCKIYWINKVLLDHTVKEILTTIESDNHNNLSQDQYKNKSSISSSDIEEMLFHIDNLPGYDVWRNIVWAIKSWCVQNQIPESIGKILIEDWSPDYKTNGLEIDKLFKDYRHGMISIRTLIFYAQNKGYEVPKKLIKPRTPGQVIVEDLLYESELYASIKGELHKYNNGVYEHIPDEILGNNISFYFSNYITDFKTGKTGFATNAAMEDAIKYAKTWFYKDPCSINPPGLNLKNGYLRLGYDVKANPTWQLIHHLPSNIFTYKAEFDYDPQADDGIFEDAFSNILDDKEQEILFRSISASFDLEEVRKRQGRSVRILLLYGDGSNGKDTVREWIYTLYGQSAITSIPLQAFRQADTNKSFSIYDIAFSRLNWSSENAAVSLDNCQTLKNCVTGDPIFVEKKHVQGHSIKIKSVFIFNINQFPHLEAKQEAIASRYGVLYFQNTFKSNPDPSDPKQIKADPRLKDDQDYILQNIMPALLNRLIRSYDGLLNSGIDYSYCKTLLQDIRERNDHFAEFMADHPIIECDIKYGLRAADIYTKYEEWCKGSGLIELIGDRKIFNDPGTYDKIVRSEVKITHKLLEYFPRLARQRSNGRRMLGIKFLLDS